MSTTLPGLHLDALLETPALVPDGLNPTVAETGERFYARLPEEAYAERGVFLKWWQDGGWRHFSYDLMAQVFSRNELLQLMWSSPVLCDFEDHFSDDRIHPYEHLFWKVRHSMWMWGWSANYNDFVRLYGGLRNLSFGPDFEVRLDHTYSINERGTAVYAPCEAGRLPLWLDGEFGLLVYYKGQHVLTVGFSLTGAGVILHQVQLREKKGNRFLYKLRTPILEYTLDRFVAAFGDVPVLLIDGQAAVGNIRKVKGSLREAFDASEAPARIQAFYDQPLQSYQRVEVAQGTYVRCYRMART